MLLKAWMDERKYKQKDVAEKLGVTQQAVSLWTTRIGTPTLLVALNIQKMTKNKVKFIDMLSDTDLAKHIRS